MAEMLGKAESEQMVWKNANRKVVEEVGKSTLFKSDVGGKASELVGLAKQCPQLEHTHNW